MQDDDEGVPATNIDDVRISIIDDEKPEKHQQETAEKHKTDKVDKVDSVVKQNKVVAPAEPRTRETRDSKKDSNKSHESGHDRNSAAVKDEPNGHRNDDPHANRKDEPNAHRRGEQQKNNNNVSRPAAPEKQNNVSRPERQRPESGRPGSTHEPARPASAHEPIHVHIGHADQASPDSRSQQAGQKRDSAAHNQQHKRPAPGVEGSPGRDRDPGVAVNPAVRQVREGAAVSRSGSFQKKRESQRQRMEQTLETVTDANENQTRNSSQSGTLSDLKKQRSENHKFPTTGTEGMVANLFLSSLSNDNNKYSSSAQHAPGRDQREKVQNGRGGPPNNNHSKNSGGQTRPPTFLSDSGPLRRFSAPTSTPVGGDDEIKFKNDCCVIL